MCERSTSVWKMDFYDLAYGLSLVPVESLGYMLTPQLHQSVSEAALLYFTGNTLCTERLIYIPQGSETKSTEYAQENCTEDKEIIF